LAKESRRERGVILDFSQVTRKGGALAPPLRAWAQKIVRNPS
jgi:hypothetical protein